MAENNTNGTAGAGTEKTFTQAEMDAIMIRSKAKERQNFRKQQKEWKLFGKSWISLRARKL